MLFVKNAGPKSRDIRGAKIAKIMVADRAVVVRRSGKAVVINLERL